MPVEVQDNPIPEHFQPGLSMNQVPQSYFERVAHILNNLSVAGRGYIFRGDFDDWQIVTGDAAGDSSGGGGGRWNVIDHPTDTTKVLVGVGVWDRNDNRLTLATPDTIAGKQWLSMTKTAGNSYSAKLDHWFAPSVVTISSDSGDVTPTGTTEEYRQIAYVDTAGRISQRAHSDFDDYEEKPDADPIGAGGYSINRNSDYQFQVAGFDTHSITAMDTNDTFPFKDVSATPDQINWTNITTFAASAANSIADALVDTSTGPWRSDSTAPWTGSIPQDSEIQHDLTGTTASGPTAADRLPRKHDRRYWFARVDPNDTGPVGFGADDKDFETSGDVGVGSFYVAGDSGSNYWNDSSLVMQTGDAGQAFIGWLDSAFADNSVTVSSTGVLIAANSGNVKYNGKNGRTVAIGYTTDTGGTSTMYFNVGGLTDS